MSDSVDHIYYETIPSYRKSYKPIWGGLFERGSLFNLEKTMVSVLHKELEYKVGKLKNKKVGGHAAEFQNQIRNFQLVNKPSRISPHEVFQS